ncbi:hypothetical protein FOBRF1_007014 [Fusarium oxysporum]
MSTPIPAVNDGGHSSPRASNLDQGNGEYQPHHKMTVISPKKEDLQNSYATVVEANVDCTRWRRMIHALGAIIGSMGALPCCVICPNPNKNVEQGNVGLVTKFGRFYKIVDPGPVAINPLSESLIQVDVKIQAVEVPEQVYTTKDNATQRLAVAITYQVVSPHIAAFGLPDVRQALIGRTKTTLRHVVGARVLQDVIEDRDEITQSLREIMDDVAAGWGIRVESMLIKNSRSS